MSEQIPTCPEHGTEMVYHHDESLWRCPHRGCFHWSGREAVKAAVKKEDK